MCGSVNLIDLLSLQNKPVDKIISARGFDCSSCAAWQVISYTSTSLEDMQQKLSRYTPEHEQYQFILKKLMRKAISMAEKSTWQ